MAVTAGDRRVPLSFLQERLTKLQNELQQIAQQYYRKQIEMETLQDLLREFTKRKERLDESSNRSA